MKSKAALSDGKGSFMFGEVEIGPPQRGEVLVEIRASGVCHTDWDTMNRTNYIVLGHEGAGVVRECGAGVAGLKPGDRVLLNWAIPCGQCFMCIRGHQNICESRPSVPLERIQFKSEGIMPSFRLGTMSQYTVVAEQALVRIPDDVEIPFESACIIGCGVMTGVGSVWNAARVEPGSSVAVLGTGGVGLSVIQGAAIAGAGMIIGVDVNPSRLELAKQFGATHGVLASHDDKDLSEAAKQVRDMTGGRGADYAFECVAKHELGPAPLRFVRNGGTAVGVSGIESTIPFNMELFEWDKTYINPLYGQCRPQRDFPRILRLYQRGLLRLDDMVTRTYKLEELGQAYDDMHAGRNAKGVLVMNHN